jgi:hypothetical protein
MHRFAHRRRATARLGLALALGTLTAIQATPTPNSAAEAPFLVENQSAMDRMMAGMDVVPSGDVDRDFTAMMIPHHQGAIDMAQAELRYGHNELLRRIAQEIIIDQQQEITAMRLALGQPHPLSIAAPNQPTDLATEAALSTPLPICKGSRR